MKKDSEFRRGANHGAQWFQDVVCAMAQGGTQPDAIAERLSTLGQVLLDWREDQAINNLPPGNPWEWRSEDLESYIARRRDQW